MLMRKLAFFDRKIYICTHVKNKFFLTFYLKKVTNELNSTMPDKKNTMNTPLKKITK